MGPGPEWLYYIIKFSRITLNDSFFQDVQELHHNAIRNSKQDIISEFDHNGLEIRDNFETHLFVQIIYQVKLSNILKMSGLAGSPHFLFFFF